MFKLFAVIAMTIAVALAKPKPFVAVSPVAYTAPVVTATSSQVIARNYNGFAAPLVAAGPVAAYTAAAPFTAAAYTAPVAAAYTSPLSAAYTSPIAAAYTSPVAAAYTSPVAAAYASPYAAAYSAYSPYAAYSYVL